MGRADRRGRQDGSMGSGRDVRPSPRRLSLLPILLFVLTLAVYLPSLGNGFIWDDDSYVTENAQLRDLAGLARIWFVPSATPQYYPLVHTTFWIERHLWGTAPLGFHLVNILLHALSAVLLRRILRGLAVPGAWLAAAVFAVHPVQVESVAWVTERKNVLSGLFAMASALAFLRARGVVGKPPVPERARRLVALSLLFFVCALLSKTVTATLPVALLLVVWWKTGKIRRQDVAAVAPMLVVGIIAGLMTAWMEKHQVGATGREWSLSFLERGLVAGRAVFFYAWKLVWPARLAFTYQRWEIDPRAAWQFLFPLAALGLIAVLWILRRRVGRGALAAILYFVATLGPALGFLDVYPFRYSFVADHFQYLASIGPIVLLVATGAAWLQRRERGGPRVSLAAAAALCLLLGLLSWRQQRIYRDQETLWTDTLAKNPSSWMAHNNLGRIFLLRGEPGRAIPHFDAAIAIKPDYFEAYLNRGNAIRRSGDPERALLDYEKASNLEPADPAPFFNRGNTMQDAGRAGEAVEAYSRAIALGLDEANVYLNRGNAYLALGAPDEAIADYTRAIERRPDLPDPYNNRAVAYLKKGEVDRAAEDLRSCRRAGGTPNPRLVEEIERAAAGGRPAGLPAGR